MRYFRTAFATIGVTSLLGLSGCSRQAGVDAVDAHTAWQAFIVDRDAQAPPLLPPEDWTAPSLPLAPWQQCWGSLFGDYGFGDPQNADALCLRTVLHAESPERVRQMRLRVSYRGGVIARLNGREVGRAHVPSGAIDLRAPADAYGHEAYAASDGGDPLPSAGRPASRNLRNYESRIRTVDLKVDPALLRPGANTLSLEIHRAPHPPLKDDRAEHDWSALGFCGATLTASPALDPAAAGAPAQAFVWNASTMDVLPADRPGTARGAHALQTTELVAPRNGHASGQVIVSLPGNCAVLSAACSPLTNSAGAAVPREAVQVLFALQDGPRFDALTPEPAPRAAVQPVWLLARVPAAQPAGDYHGDLKIETSAEAISAPIRLHVAGWAAPDPARNTHLLSFLQSPDTLAEYYHVTNYSSEHFDLIDASLSLMGEAGNDVVYIPVVRYTHLGNNESMVRFRREGDKVHPDLSVAEKYLEHYERLAGQPKAVVLDVWNQDIMKGGAPHVRTVSDDGALGEMKAPLYGEPGSEAFWKPVMDGFYAYFEKRGWPAEALMLGVAADWWPRPATVEFFKAIAPRARWSIYTHGHGPVFRRAHGPAGLVLPNGMTIGHFEHIHGDEWEADERDERLGSTSYVDWVAPHLQATSLRATIAEWSPPIVYRQLADLSVNKRSQGLGRVGLDYWPVGGSALLGRYESWYELARTSPRGLTAPGPRGALRTVRYQMLVQGIEEAEARIAIARATSKPDSRLGPELAKACGDLLDKRRRCRVFNTYAPSAQIGCDYEGMARELFELAQRVTEALAR